MSIRYPNSEYLPDEILKDLMEDEEVISTPKTSSVEFIKKTLVGRNSETKRVIELSAGDIEDMTGISHAEMFGTDQSGEKIAYIGAPWQGKIVMDSKRFFVFDYEYGEIANFTRSFRDLLDRIYSTFHGEFSYGLADFANLLKTTELDISAEELIWAQTVFELANELFEDVKKIVKINDQTDLTKAIKEASLKLQEMLTLRAERDAELMKKREAERIEIHGEHGLDHPVEGIHRFCKYLTNTVSRSMRDIEDYTTTVKPHMDAFELSLDAGLPGIDRVTKIKQEELSVLNGLRLRKQAENSEIIVGIFPNLPLKSESIDRVVCSYSISTHVIADADQTDFESWLGEIQRVLKPGGKAYIFPMQEGFPYGRSYDELALSNAMGTFDTQSGGKLSYEWYENPNTDAWRQDTTLIITKK